MTVVLFIIKYFIIGALIQIIFIGAVNLLIFIADKLNINIDHLLSFVAGAVVAGLVAFLIESAIYECQHPPQNPIQIERSYNQK